MAVIFFTLFLDLVGFGIVLPLLPQFARQHHAQEWQIGLLMASYSLMQFFFSPVWGRLSDRIGRRPVLLISITGSAISYLLFAFAPTLEMLFVSRLFAGAMAANIATAQAYVADVTTAENRTKGMGMVGAAFGLGFVLGPALAGVLSHWARQNGHSPQLVVGIAAACFSLIDLVWAAARLPESLTPEIRAKAVAAVGNRLERMIAALQKPALGLPILLFFIGTVAWSQLEPTLARYVQEQFRFDEAQTGYMFAFVGVIVALVQGGFAGRMAKKRGEARMVLTGALLLAVGLACVPEVRGVGALYGILAILAAGQAMVVPALQSLVSKAAAAEEQGSTLGVSQGFSSLARVIGPSMGGVLFGIGHAIPFWSASGLMVLCLLLAGRLRSSTPVLA
jgi:DHA1 family tetracycline resistance protein-like MFS transporter